MFQRLKGFNLDSFLDTKIAEEQAKQRQGQPSGPRRTPSQARRTSARTDSPSKRPTSRIRGGDAENGQTAKGPDPSEFVIDDDDISSRAPTPRPPGEDVEAPQSKEEKPSTSEEKKPQDDATMQDKTPEKDTSDKSGDDLPQDVQVKLRKLQKLESRYHDLLRSYRVAHARVSAIEPFEATLREHTPLASINDPSALVEFLSQINLKGDMVMDELKRVTGDRDTLKVKLEEAERRTKEAYDEVTGLRKERDDLQTKQSPNTNAKLEDGGDPLGVSNGTKGPFANKDEDFFSYESEVPRLQDELQETAKRVEELVAENSTLRQTLETAQTSQPQEIADYEGSAGTPGAEAEQITQQQLDLTRRLEESERSITEIQEALNEAMAQTKEETEVPGTLVERVHKLGNLVKSARSVSNAAESHLNDVNAGKESAEAALKELEEKHAAYQQDSESSSSENTKRINTLDNLVKTMRGQLSDAETTKRTAESELQALRAKLKVAESELDTAKSATSQGTENAEAVATLREQLDQAERDRNDAYRILIDSGLASFAEDNAEMQQETPAKSTTEVATLNTPGEPAKAESVAAKKKNKNKKKKKGPNTDAIVPAPTEDDATAKIESETPKIEQVGSRSVGLSDAQLANIKKHIGKTQSHTSCEATISDLKKQIISKNSEIESLTAQIKDKAATIDRLSDRMKGEEDLHEEIEGLKDDLMHIGNEHVAAKDQVKTLRAEKEGLTTEHAESLRIVEDRCQTLKERAAELEHKITDKEEQRTKLETELETLKSSSGSSTKDLEGQLALLVAEKQAIEKRAASEAEDAGKKEASHSSDLQEAKDRTSSLQTDLSAANELAQSRYKDLVALREHVNKLQPELKNLKKEAEKLKKASDDVQAGNEKIRQLESQAEQLKSEMGTQRSQLKDKDSEVKSLIDKLKQSTERTSDLEEKERALSKAEAQQQETATSRDRLSRELDKAKSELETARRGIMELEAKATKLNGDASAARDELELKSAQQASAQSLMDSMQDQTRELATQMREVKERCESLEEELADAHRLLSERSREGETMRRLLADVEGRADARIKEMRERMDLATEERDRAEEEASNIGRRKARELDDLRNKLKEAEKQRQAAIDDKESFEKRESGYQSQKDSLERRAAQAQGELDEVRSAMTQLRDALDEGERQAREAEKERSELKRALDDKEARLEKVQKGSKSMAEELRSLHSASKSRQAGSHVPSTRSSMESQRIGSPARNGSVATTGGPDAQPALDYVYLKNVLLQFLEQKDKKHQMQLVPVLGMLLHFDRKDEQKWVSAISAK